MKVNGMDIKRASHAEALALFRSCEYQLTLEIEFDVTIHGMYVCVYMHVFWISANIIDRVWCYTYDIHCMCIYVFIVYILCVLFIHTCVCTYIRTYVCNTYNVPQMALTLLMDLYWLKWWSQVMFLLELHYLVSMYSIHNNHLCMYVHTYTGGYVCVLVCCMLVEMVKPSAISLVITLHTWSV